MPPVTFQQASGFLNQISPKDKVAIIHHDDLDGFASGILFYDFCEKKGAGVENFSFTISKEFNPNLEKFDKILIADLAPNLINPTLEKIKHKQVLYTDHHPKDQEIPTEILELRTINLGYIPSSRTCYELTKGNEFWGLTGTIGDAGELYEENKEFITNLLSKTGLTLEEYKEKVDYKIGNFLVYFEKDLEKAFEVLRKINSIKDIESIEKYYQIVQDNIDFFVKNFDENKEKINNINFYYFEPKFAIKTAVINIISRKHPEEILVFATKRKDEKMIKLGARNQVRKFDMAELLKAGIKNLESASAGGHIPAAGAAIKAKDLQKFKQNLKNYAKNIK